MLNDLMPGLSAIPNIHPLTVHFPIALLMAALGLQAAALIGNRDAWAGHARACLYLGTLGALAAAGTGWLAADGLGHDSPGHEFVHVHRNFMAVSTLLALGTSMASWHLAARAPQRDRAVLLGLVCTCAVLTLGADRGANLVFRYGVGVSSTSPPAAAHEDGHTDEHAVPAEPAPPPPESDHSGHDH